MLQQQDFLTNQHRKLRRTIIFKMRYITDDTNLASMFDNATAMLNEYPQLALVQGINEVTS